LAEIIYSRVQMDILNQIQKAITESGYENRIRAGVVLTGGGSSLRHLKELCQYTLQRSTRIGIPDIGFVGSIPAELKYPMFATALGLLKHGIQANEKKLFEDEEVVEEGTKDKGKKKKGGKDKGGKDKGGKDTNNGKKEKSIWESIKGFLDDLTEKTS